MGRQLMTLIRPAAQIRCKRLAICPLARSFSHARNDTENPRADQVFEIGNPAYAFI